MSHDGSLKSQVEAWLVSQIAEIAPFVVADAAGFQGKVEVYKGSEAPGGQPFLAAMFAERTPYVCVHYNDSRAIDTTEGAIDDVGSYVIWVAVQHNRSIGSARTGESVTTPAARTIQGSNGLGELIRAKLHNAAPDVTAHGFYAEPAQFRSANVAYETKGRFILQAVVEVREVPAAN